MNTIFFYGTALDALLVLVVGVYAASLYLFGKVEQLDIVYKRVFPAVATLIGTTVAAGFIVWVGGKMFLR